MFQDIIITKALGLHGPFLSPNCPLPRSFSSTSRVTISFPLIFYFILPYQHDHIHRHTKTQILALQHFLPGKISTKKSFEQPEISFNHLKLALKHPNLALKSLRLAPAQKDWQQYICTICTLLRLCMIACTIVDAHLYL